MSQNAKGVALGTLSPSVLARVLAKNNSREKYDYGCVLSLRSQVTPTSNEDASDLTELTVGNSSKFNQLVQSGDVRAATQLANAVLHTANQLNSTTTQDKISVRNNIVSKHSQ